MRIPGQLWDNACDYLPFGASATKVGENRVALVLSAGVDLPPVAAVFFRLLGGTWARDPKNDESLPGAHAYWYKRL